MKNSSFWYFFPAECEYLNYFIPTRTDLPKFYVKGLKITPNGCFKIVLKLKITNSFDAKHAQCSSKGIFLTPMYNLELYIRTIWKKKTFTSLLELKRMQVFPLKMQYHKALSEFFKNKSVKAYEILIRSKSTNPTTL